MNRRDFLRTSGGGTFGLPLAQSDGFLDNTPHLLNAWFEVQKNGNAKFVLRFDHDTSVWSGWRNSKDVITEALSFPGISEDQVQLQERGETIEVSTLPDSNEERRVQLGEYNNRDSGAECRSMAEVLKYGTVKQNLKPKNKNLSRYTIVGTDDTLSAKYDSWLDLVDLLKVWEEDDLETFVYSEPDNLLGGTITDFVAVEDTELDSVYSMESPVVFGEGVDTSGAYISIKFPPGVTYDANTIRNLGQPSELPELPTFSHYSNARLGAVANGARFAKSVIDENIRKNLYDGETYTELMSGGADEMYSSVTATLNDVMVDMIGTVMFGPPIDGLVDIMMMAMNPGYCRLERELDELDEAIDASFEEWIGDVEKSHESVQDDLATAESLAFQATRESDPREVVSILDELELALEEVQSTAVEAKDRIYEDEMYTDSPLRQFGIDVFEFLDAQFAETALALVAEEKVRHEQLSTQDSDLIGFAYDGELTITYVGSDSRSPDETFIGISESGDLRGFLWSDLSDTQSVDEGDSVTIAPEMTVREKTWRFELEESIVRVFQSESGGQLSEELGVWKGPNAPEDSYGS